MEKKIKWPPSLATGFAYGSPWLHTLSCHSLFIPPKTYLCRRNIWQCICFRSAMASGTTSRTVQGRHQQPCSASCKISRPSCGTSACCPHTCQHYLDILWGYRLSHRGSQGSDIAQHSQSQTRREEETFSGNPGLAIFAVAFCCHDLPSSLDVYEEGFSIGAARVILESGGQNLVKNGISTRNTHMHRERERKRERSLGSG